jgi:hypothetical protein
LDKNGNDLITAYPIERPDGQWSVMLINKDENHDHSVGVSFADPATKQTRYFTGTVDRVVFGPAEYQWHPDPTPPAVAPALPAGTPNAVGAQASDGQGGGGQGGRRRFQSGHPDPDGPASKSAVTGAGVNTLYDLPKASIVVLRGNLGAQ